MPIKTSTIQIRAFCAATRPVGTGTAGSPDTCGPPRRIKTAPCPSTANAGAVKILVSRVEGRPPGDQEPGQPGMRGDVPRDGDRREGQAAGKQNTSGRREVTPGPREWPDPGAIISPAPSSQRAYRTADIVRRVRPRLATERDVQGRQGWTCCHAGTPILRVPVRATSSTPVVSEFPVMREGRERRPIFAIYSVERPLPAAACGHGELCRQAAVAVWAWRAAEWLSRWRGVSRRRGRQRRGPRLR